ncbi:hypothetical protein THAOC_08002 [Thalassiosira oceanica]|uniref:Peptide deformylase n=1 Tax=Thalassiosira oceanica TaxID=159749 RepID=K0SW34_THAOC|nr:hypothetical protein THAOC_08002 [Thalassiosira oceanica]|eukprot:EJK70623.1 hypothetical protein THAOC_08002 [Thalassiosira oceanica]
MKLSTAALISFALTIPKAKCLLQYQRLKAPRVANKKHDRQPLQMRLNPTSFKGTDYIITEFPRPSLRRVPNAPVAAFDDEFEAKTQEMLSIMYEAKGVGLAAPQVGINEDFFVYNPSDSKNMERVVCNPTITKYSEEIVVDNEGFGTKSSSAAEGLRGEGVPARIRPFAGYTLLRRFPPEDREAVRENIDRLLGLYDDDDALIEPNADEFGAMKPRPLSSRWMPALESEADKDDGDDDIGFAAPKKAKKPSGGFGAGGGGGKKASGKKKKGPKKKVRDGSRSSDPRFKSSGRTPFASRK